MANSDVHNVQNDPFLYSRHLLAGAAGLGTEPSLLAKVKCKEKLRFLFYQYRYFTLMFYIMYRRLPLDSLNITEKIVVGDVIATVKALDRDEDSNITYAFAKTQTVFHLDPSK